jgi:hypothetical protein
MMQTVRKNDAVHDQFASVLQLIQDLQLAPDAEVEKRKSPIEEATIGAALKAARSNSIASRRKKDLLILCGKRVGQL